MDQDYLQESKCLEIQANYKAKVMKQGVMYKRKGVFIKKYKPFEVFLLDDGTMVFYTLTTTSKKFGKESTTHRIRLDESLQLNNRREITY